MIVFSISGSSYAQESCLEAVGGFPYGPVRAIAQDGDRVVYGSGRAMMIADVVPPSTVVPVGDLTLGALIEDILLAGDLAYVAHPTGLTVVDLSTPEMPVVVGEVATQLREEVDLEIYGSHVFAASDRDPVKIIDVGNPANPVELGSSGTIGTATSIEVDDGRLYTLANGLLIIFGLTDPANPEELGRGTLPGGGSEFGVVGPRAYVVGSDSLYFIEVGWPSWIHQIGSPVPLGGVLYDIEIQGSTAVIPAATANGLEMLLVDLYGNVLGSVEMPTLPLSFSINPRRLCFSDRYTGLHLADISDPAAPVPIAEIEAPGYMFKVAAAGDQVFASSVPAEGPYWQKRWESYTTDFRAFEVSDPDNPVQTDRLDFGEWVFPPEVIIEGGLAYVTDTFRIVSVADPELMEVLGELPYRLYGIAKRGSLIYAVHGDFVVMVVDVSDPSNPTLAGNWVPQLPHGQEAFDISIANGHGYVVSTKNDYTSGLFSVLDLTDPLEPVVVGSVELPESPVQVVVKGVHAFVRNYYSPNLHIVDIADPTTPQIVAAVPWGWWDGHLVISGDVLYSARGTEIFVIGIGRPDSPELICELDPGTRVDSLAVSRGELYVATGDTGFSIYRQYGGAILLDGFEIGTTENWTGVNLPPR